MLKESNLDIKYWPEMIGTANYLRNRQPVTGKSMTPFEASYGRRPQLGHLCRIRQIRYAQGSVSLSGSSDSYGPQKIYTLCESLLPRQLSPQQPRTG